MEEALRGKEQSEYWSALKPLLRKHGIAYTKIWKDGGGKRAASRGGQWPHVEEAGLELSTDHWSVAVIDKPRHGGHRHCVGRQ